MVIIISRKSVDIKLKKDEVELIDDTVINLFKLKAELLPEEEANEEEVKEYLKILEGEEWEDLDEILDDLFD
ncbi:hypothetical protein Metin_0974 [Methanocaldococcus infernus ME]|uniref:Uncharacterized protein n=1 Tax=Methanocaldococcus infernus (strain DSM 11812 / JCM 15783 / ME) TaxID=573063 RepID=D5VSS9_METIM|nr:hypothetical protein [Methanocaldococcus infernus]ADG13632.1 hypothetical protein Metin_0974 [Methanocaldococcus infernus ME]